MIVNVPLDHLSDNPFQRRQDYGDVEGLAADIMARGLLQTPVGRLVYDHGEVIPQDAAMGACRRIEADGFPAGLRVQLAFGHRRLRAFVHLQTTQAGGYPTMPVFINTLSDDEMLDAVWSENQNRSDINAIEQAELLAEKLERARAAGGNQATVAAEWNLARPTIANKLRLLELPADVQSAVRARTLSERQALALLPVLDLDAKLNGAATKWGDTGGEGWLPRSPQGYVAQVLKSPEKATSDAIREYTQTAVNHAGNPLPDAFAAFEAGEGTGIVQSACKGCPKRYNQTCLNETCHETRAKRFRALLPEWAARETGLPFEVDFGAFAGGRDELEANQADWEAGRHDDLVCGIMTGYYLWRPYSERSYARDDYQLKDWKESVIIGRRGGPAPESAAEEAPALPDEADLARWTKAQAKAEKERTGRVKQALRSRVAPLVENEEPLRALTAMLLGYDLRQMQERGERPSAEELVDLLFAKAWDRADTREYGYDFSTNRNPLRRLLEFAAVSPDVVDPPDPTLRLLDIGHLALLAYNNTRQRVDISHAYERVRLLRETIDEFDKAPSAVYGSEELQQIFAYLRSALEYEEAKIAREAPANPD